MKKLFLFSLTCIFVASAGHLFGQKLKSGSLSVLKGQKVINLSYDYAKMEVGKFKSEEEYVKKGTDDRNKKKAGSGDAWAAKWNSGKTERYQPAFQDEINRMVRDCGLKFQEDPSAKYTFVVHTEFMEVGVETVVMGSAKSAEINMEVELIETSAPDNVIATIEMPNAKPKSNTRVSIGGVPVNKEVYDPTIRVAECYETAGKQIGKMICKLVK